MKILPSILPFAQTIHVCRAALFAGLVPEAQFVLESVASSNTKPANTAAAQTFAHTGVECTDVPIERRQRKLIDFRKNE